MIADYKRIAEGGMSPDAHKTVDEPSTVIRVLDGDRIRWGVLHTEHASRYLHFAECARVYIRQTRWGKVHVVCVTDAADSMASPEKGGVSSEIYYGTSGNFVGVTAALAGIPVGWAVGRDGGRHRVILTESRGLEGVLHPWGPRQREVLLVPRGLPGALVLL